eukprot:jgi/Botrbrau1/416/Bobra.110_2s0066.1
MTLMLALCTWSFRIPLLRDDAGSNDRRVEGLDLHWPEIMSEILQQWSSRIDWNFMNFLACAFDSLDIRRDGTVQLRTFLARLSGYDPVVDAPLEVQAANEQRDEALGLMRQGRRTSRRARRLQNRLAQALGEEPRPVNLRNTQLVPGVTRLTGAGYIGQESSLAPRTPVLTLEEQEMFLRVNDEIEKLLLLFELVMAHPFALTATDIRLMVVILATCSGAAHREAFVEKLLQWKLSDSINARGLL